MDYDFDAVIDRRNTDSVKWGTLEPMFGDRDVLPMWVADMDFPVAEPITDALRKRTEHPFYGYSLTLSSVVDTVVERLNSNYSWKIKPEWVVFTPGVIPAIDAAIRAFSHSGDEVIIQSPVYYPFWSTIRNSGRQIVDNELSLIDGRYVMNYENLEKKFDCRDDGMTPSSCRARLMILCNPHNPVGRVWSREEQTRAGEIALKHNALMISDEVHCELLFKGFRHTPFATLSAEFEKNSITCMAPSKTFNLAGLRASSIIIPDACLRDKFNAARKGIQAGPDVFGLVALEAAYRHGDEWLQQLLHYLQGNLKILIDYFAKKIPRIKVIIPEGTYLVWLDCRGLGMKPEELRKFMRQKAKVGLDDGYLFGPTGAGFQRINIACPRAVLEEALHRISDAVAGLS